MRRIQLLCAIGVSLWSAIAAGRQAPESGTLPGALRQHVQEQYGIVTSIRGLPLGVRDELQVMFSSGGLDIADPGAEFRKSGAAGNPNLPLRRLVAAGCARDFHCLVYYERGGVDPTWHVALFHWTPAATRFEWGGTAPGNLKTIDEVRNAVLSGAIKAPAKFW